MIPLPELATAWITLAVSADNMQRDIRRELQKVDDGTAKTVGKKIGQQIEAGVGDGAKGAATQVQSRLSERLGTQVGTVVGRGIGTGLRGSITVAAKAGELALKTAMVGAAGAATLAVGGIGLALTKGFDRLKSIDQAKFKLLALGNDAASVAKIMDSALASVKGTAFGMDDAVTAAASAVAAGIKPGQDLTKYLKDVGDAAAIAGTNFTDMGSIFNKIQTSNKAYTDDLQQLSDRGIPIFTWLQKEYGVTAAALSKMVQDGDVDAAHFQHAIETNIGGAALKMGQSFQGSVDNAEAALGRLGAALLAPVFGNAAGGIGSITGGLDSLTAWINAHQAEVITFFQDMGITAVEVAQDIVKSFGNIMQGVGQLTNGLGDVLDFFGVDNKFHSIGDQIEHIGDSLVTTSEGFDTAKDRIRAWGDAARESAENAQNAVGKAVSGIGTAVGALPFKKVIEISADTDAAKNNVVGIGNAVAALQDKNINVTVNGQVSAPNAINLPGIDGTQFKGPIDRWLDGGDAPTFNPPNPIRSVPRRAAGGSVFGAGSATSDSIPALLSNGEHVWTAAEVRKAGGHGAMYRMRAMVRRLAGGGGIKTAQIPWPPGPIGPTGDGEGNIPDPSPGNYPGRIAIPDWSVPGQGWGPPPADWWTKPVNPDDILVPDAVDPGKRQQQREIWERLHPRIKMLGFSGGGAVSIDAVKQYAAQIAGGQYVRGGPPGLDGTDCSGAQAAISNFITGGQGRFATGDEGAALMSRGFQQGDPPPGVAAYWVGWKNGGPGGGHTAGTIIDPQGGDVNVEMGGASGGGAFGAAAAGASGFPNRAWIQIAGGEDPKAADSFGSGTAAVQSATAAVTSSKGAVTSARAGLDQAQAAVDDAKATGKSADQIAVTEKKRDAARQKLDAATQKQTAAETKLANVKDKAAKGSDKATGGMDGQSMGQQLGQGIFGGILQSIGLDGSEFSNPFDWPNVKSLMAGLNFGGSLLKGVMGGQEDGSSADGGGGGGIPGLGLPNITDFLKPGGPQATTPLPDAAHQGTGAAPGPTFNVTANGMDPKAVVDKQSHAFNQAWRGSGMAAVRPS